VLQSQKNKYIKNELTSADPRRYASAEVLIFTSDWRRGPDAFTGSPVVLGTDVADFFMNAQSHKAQAD